MTYRVVYHYKPNDPLAELLRNILTDYRTVRKDGN